VSGGDATVVVRMRCAWMFGPSLGEISGSARPLARLHTDPRHAGPGDAHVAAIQSQGRQTGVTPTHPRHRPAVRPLFAGLQDHRGLVSGIRKPDVHKPCLLHWSHLPHPRSIASIRAWVAIFLRRGATAQRLPSSLSSGYRTPAALFLLHKQEPQAKAFSIFFASPCLHIPPPTGSEGVADSTRPDLKTRPSRRCASTGLFTRRRVACERKKGLQDATIGPALALFASQAQAYPPPVPLPSSSHGAESGCRS
jgi:hypothetical protein